MTKRKGFTLIEATTTIALVITIIYLFSKLAWVDLEINYWNTQAGIEGSAITDLVNSLYTRSYNAGVISVTGSTLNLDSVTYEFQPTCVKIDGKVEMEYDDFSISESEDCIMIKLIKGQRELYVGIRKRL